MSTTIKQRLDLWLIDLGLSRYILYNIVGTSSFYPDRSISYYEIYSTPQRALTEATVEAFFYAPEDEWNFVATSVSRYPHLWMVLILILFVMTVAIWT